MPKPKVLLITKNPEHLPRCLDRLKQDCEVEITKSISGLQNYMDNHDDGLNYYDIILMDPYLNYTPLFSYEETDEGLLTGWLLYHSFMKDLEIKVVIYSHIIDTYTELNWGSNVELSMQHTNDDDYFISLVKQHTRS